MKRRTRTLLRKANSGERRLLERALRRSPSLRRYHVDLDQLAIGTKVEMEHTRRPAEAAKIALDHLRERKDYYVLLARMEKSPKKPTAYAARDQEDFGTEREARIFQHSLTAQGAPGVIYGETRSSYRVYYPKTVAPHVLHRAKQDVRRSSRPPPMRDKGSGPRRWKRGRKYGYKYKLRDRPPYRKLTRQQERWASNKIRLLRHEGYPEKQAVAIALSMARRRPKRAKGKR